MYCVTGWPRQMDNKEAGPFSILVADYSGNATPHFCIALTFVPSPKHLQKKPVSLDSFCQSAGRNASYVCHHRGLKLGRVPEYFLTRHSIELFLFRYPEI